MKGSLISILGIMTITFIRNRRSNRKKRRKRLRSRLRLRKKKNFKKRKQNTWLKRRGEKELRRWINSGGSSPVSKRDSRRRKNHCMRTLKHWIISIKDFPT